MMLNVSLLQKCSTYLRQAVATWKSRSLLVLTSLYVESAFAQYSASMPWDGVICSLVKNIATTWVQGAFVLIGVVTGIALAADSGSGTVKKFAGFAIPLCIAGTLPSWAPRLGIGTSFLSACGIL
jgi:type IV secretory pathway VirB2 component (pilin)